MDASQVKRIFVSAAASSVFAVSAPMALPGHLIEFEPDRPQVSPACLPNWGYHQTCWKRFGPMLPCDSCDNSFLFPQSSEPLPPEIYVPQSSFPSAMPYSSDVQYSTQPYPSSAGHSLTLPEFPVPPQDNGSVHSPPLSIFPADTDTNAARSGGSVSGNLPVPAIPAPLAAPPAAPLQPVPSYTPPAATFPPENNTPRSQPSGSLPPLPAPMEQSRYGGPVVAPPLMTLRSSVPSSAGDASRYGQAASAVPPRGSQQIAGQTGSPQMASQPAPQQMAGHQGFGPPQSVHSGATSGFSSQAFPGSALSSSSLSDAAWPTQAGSPPAASPAPISSASLPLTGSNRYSVPQSNPNPFRSISQSAQPQGQQPQQYTTMPSGLLVPSGQASAMLAQPPAQSASARPSAPLSAPLPRNAPRGTSSFPQDGLSHSRYGQPVPHAMPPVPESRPLREVESRSPEAAAPLIAPAIRIPQLRRTP